MDRFGHKSADKKKPVGILPVVLFCISNPGADHPMEYSRQNAGQGTDTLRKYKVPVYRGKDGRRHSRYGPSQKPG